MRGENTATRKFQTILQCSTVDCHNIISRDKSNPRPRCFSCRKKRKNELSNERAKLKSQERKIVKELDIVKSNVFRKMNKKS